MRSSTTSFPDFSAVDGRRLLIALSGGADSVALTSMLAEVRHAHHLTLFAAHLDHGIRPESAVDAAFCRALCEKLSIPFLSRRVDVPALSRSRGAGLESLAREVRYQWLRDCLRETGSDFIALAHHLDDQAETVLMHLARGAGPEGICGMRTFSGDLYRPLLNLRKAELIEYLRDKGLGWREDSTNAVADNPRNGLRLHAIPEMEKCYPQFARAAARYALSAQIESDFLDELTRQYLDLHRCVTPLCAWLDLSDPPPRAVLRRALRSVFQKQTIVWDRLNALEALCAASRGRLDLGGEFIAERAGHRLYVVPKHPGTIPSAQLSLNGETLFTPLCKIIAAPSAPVPIRDDPARQVLNARALRGAVVRTRREGDRIRPLGGGDKLLSDYFIDKKIDRPLRDLIPLIAVGSRVHWVCGLGISQEASVHPGDEAVMLQCKHALPFSRGEKTSFR